MDSFLLKGRERGCDSKIVGRKVRKEGRKCEQDVLNKVESKLSFLSMMGELSIAAVD